MIRRPPRSTQSRSSAASDVYKRQDYLVLPFSKNISFPELSHVVPVSFFHSLSVELNHDDRISIGHNERNCPSHILDIHGLRMDRNIWKPGDIRRLGVCLLYTS